jgi:hypothetical protein
MAMLVEIHVEGQNFLCTATHQNARRKSNVLDLNHWGINLSMPVKSDCQVKPGYLSRFEPDKNVGLKPMLYLKILIYFAGDYQV